MTSVATTSLPLTVLRRGKVRDVYEVDADRLLVVATDRVSAFDVVMRETVAYKGAVLTQLTAWWLRQIETDVPHHMITADADRIVREVPALEPYHDLLRGRAMLAWRADVFPVECVIRGYIAGSAWKEYRTSGTLAGEPLRTGLRESDRLDPPVFSPATKAESGHDENITVAHMARIVGDAAAGRLEAMTRAVYERGCEIAEPRGIIIADTKFEFGTHNGRIIIVDEVLTPDSSRFWPAAAYSPGQSQPSFDKQPLRDYLDSERVAGRWSGDYPPPPLPESVVHATSTRYRDAYRRITGSDLDIAGLS
jgi:phosphoribosylaminoimidazole-succinocarboxamide synthase